MKFVTGSAPATNDDPRQAIVLRGVDAQVTSGTLVKNRILAAEGTLFEGKGLLVLAHPRIESRDRDTTIAAKTSATTAVFYLAGDASKKHQKGDMEMTGNVRHVVPAKSDPTTASVIIETENLAWRAATQIFEANSFYRMTLNVPGKSPLVAIGDAFVASRDLRNWNVKHGGLATFATTDDFRASNAAKSLALAAEVPDAPQSGVQTSGQTAADEPAMSSNLRPPVGDSAMTSATLPVGRQLHRMFVPQQ
jgi:hypothetical protein